MGLRERVCVCTYLCVSRKIHFISTFTLSAYGSVATTARCTSDGAFIPQLSVRIGDGGCRAPCLVRSIDTVYVCSGPHTCSAPPKRGAYLEEVAVDSRV